MIHDLLKNIEMERWAHKVALVTGASAGIGAQIVRELAKNGMKVIAIARRLDRLQKLTASIKHEHKIDIYPMQCDIGKEEDILKIFKWADEKLGGVDVLINNAAVLYSESIIGNFLLSFCFSFSFLNANLVINVSFPKQQSLKVSNKLIMSSMRVKILKQIFFTTINYRQSIFFRGF